MTTAVQELERMLTEERAKLAKYEQRFDSTVILQSGWRSHARHARRDVGRMVKKIDALQEALDTMRAKDNQFDIGHMEPDDPPGSQP